LSADDCMILLCFEGIKPFYLDHMIKNMTSRGTMASKMTRMNTYVEDVVKVTRSKNAMEESLKALNENANEVGLSINQEKTKYLEIKTKRSNINRNTNAKMGQHYFERVQTFIS
jgi:hypothetical protein